MPIVSSIPPAIANRDFPSFFFLANILQSILANKTSTNKYVNALHSCNSKKYLLPPNALNINKVIPIDIEIPRDKLVVVTGLSGSGKSTVALGVERELHSRGILCRILDGDNIRAGINNNLGFSAEDRTENIRRIAEIGKLFVQTGVVTLACFVSPTRDIRRMAREIVGTEDFLEVFVSTPIEECERRDVKGLYARARRGEVKDFTGVSAPFEAPLSPDLDIDTSALSLQESVDKVLQLILAKSGL